ncbi:MAG TPA: replication initiator, partial [Mycobacteriales bacterium]|nr:replication initiator [Mycobacteriales bacterium]
RAWAHALGWRGHPSTRSRRYSTTLTALRRARAEHQASERAASPDSSRPQGVDLVVERDWRYVGRVGGVR